MNGNFPKFVDIFKKIQDKSGHFDLIVLIGCVFNKDMDFSLVKLLDSLITKIVIFDSSEVGTLIKHKITDMFDLSDNVAVLGRSGVITVCDLKIAFLNGHENKKYLINDEKYKYTSSFFSRADVDILLKDNFKVDLLLLHSIPTLIYDELIKYFVNT